MRPVQRFSDEQLAHARTLSPDQIVQFLDDFRQLHAGREAREASTLISLRVPAGLLRSFRYCADAAGVPYQAQIKRLMEQWVRTRTA
jgi:predicted DNA binding CopG/RHH family protein